MTAVATEEHSETQKPKRNWQRLTLPRIFLHGFLFLTAMMWLLPLLWAIYTSLRPYSDTAERGYVSLPGTMKLRQLCDCLDAGGIPEVLHQHGHCYVSSADPDSVFVVAGGVWRGTFQLPV